MSRHAATMRPLNHDALGQLAPVSGPIAGTDYTLTPYSDGYGFAATGAYPNPIQLALGSGKTGMTYIDIVNNSRLIEIHLSYFPHQRRWLLTPGQAGAPAGSVGKVYRDADAHKCLGCHSVQPPDQPLMPEAKFMGVGCEACHGPCAAHVTAMRAHQFADPKTPDLSKLGGTQVSDLCGKCHRTAKDPLVKAAGLNGTQRFQAYGLSLSRCFKGSNNKLSCVVCHDPHTDASTRESDYVTTCLKCHGPSASDYGSLGVRAKPCPVNRQDRCIECHMPSRRVFITSDAPTYMADHDIRIFHKVPTN